MAKNVARTKYLIIGNSAGGIAAAEAIREVDKAGEIIIISDEPYPAYSRPLISEYLAKRCPVERMLLRPPDFYERNHIRTLLGKKAKRLDVKERIVELESGEKISWKRLLLATGGLPIIPPTKGLNLGGVFTFTTLNDAMAIDQFLSQLSQRTTRAVVIGGGLIGISVTEALVKRGAQVTIVEMKERILNTILDEEASVREEETVTDVGVEIMTGHTVAEINSYAGEHVTSVTLDDGRPIPCGLVIVAIGVQPRLELISGSGIEVNHGIVVDRHMATSNPDVFAGGDVAEAYDFIYGENRLTPIWPNAYMGGRVAGFNMAGVSTEYSGGTAMNSLKYFGLAVVSAGMVDPPDGSYEVISNKRDHVYKKLVLKDGLIAGMVFADDIEKSGIVFGLMKERVKVDGFKQALVADDFGLTSLPEEMWRARLGIPASGFVSSMAILEQPKELAMGE
jgi:NAD(P)H-nitrite reductase large subunit